jgi:hypothetical protein
LRHFLSIHFQHIKRLVFFPCEIGRGLRVFALTVPDRDDGVRGFHHFEIPPNAGALDGFLPVGFENTSRDLVGGVFEKFTRKKNGKKSDRK